MLIWLPSPKIHLEPLLIIFQVVSKFLQIQDPTWTLSWTPNISLTLVSPTRYLFLKIEDHLVFSKKRCQVIFYNRAKTNFLIFLMLKPLHFLGLHILSQAPNGIRFFSSKPAQSKNFWICYIFSMNLVRALNKLKAWIVKFCREAWMSYNFLASLSKG